MTNNAPQKKWVSNPLDILSQLEEERFQELPNGCNQKQLLGRSRMRLRILKRPLFPTKRFSLYSGELVHSFLKLSVKKKKGNVLKDLN